MGKKNRKNNPQSKKKLCPTFTDRIIQRLVEDMWERTSKWSGISLVSPSIPTLMEDYDALMSMIDQLRRRQGSSPVPLPPREKGIKEFKDWLKHNGASFDKVDIASYPGSGLGLKVIEEIEESEMVLKIPHNLMLSWDGVMKSSLGPFIKADPLLNAMPNLAMALSLLNERYNPNSFWRPYINVLPNSFNLPMFYHRDELQELCGSPVLAEAISQLRNITRLYAVLYQRLKSQNNPELFVSSIGFHYMDFVWAVSCVMSRQNKIPLKKSGETSLVLIPFWDMSNHAPGKIFTDFDSESGSCVCYSMKKFSPGEEFTIFYGPRSNTDLFLNQGFTYDGNPYDSLKVPMGLSRMEDNTTRQLRQKLLEGIKIQVPGQFPVKGGNTPFSPELMAFTRVFTATPQLLSQWKDLTKEELREVLMSENLYQRDIKALEFLENRCLLLLQPYKTTLEDDERLLSDPNLSHRLRYVTLLRINEKKILRNASKLARQERENMVVQLDKMKNETDSHATPDTHQNEDESIVTGNESNEVNESQTVVPVECSEPPSTTLQDRNESIPTTSQYRNESCTSQDRNESLPSTTSHDQNGSILKTSPVINGYQSNQGDVVSSHDNHDALITGTSSLETQD